MDGILRSSHEGEEVRFGNLKVSLFADDVVLLVYLGHDFQRVVKIKCDGICLLSNMQTFPFMEAATTKCPFHSKTFQWNYIQYQLNFGLKTTLIHYCYTLCNLRKAPPHKSRALTPHTLLLPFRLLYLYP